MAANKSFKSQRNSKSVKASKVPRLSLVALTSATKAFKKISPSSGSFLSLLSSATLMHPEIPLDVRRESSPLIIAHDINERSIDRQSMAAEPRSPSPISFDRSVHDAEDDYDTTTSSLSAISSQRHLTFPPAIKTGCRSRSSFELPRSDSPWSAQTVSGIGQGTIVNDSTRSGIDNLLRTFSDETVHIHGSQMIHRHDIAQLVELHMLSWREDRFVRRLQQNQIPRAEVQTMRSMLADRTTSALDNVLVARINNSHDPKDIVGWLSCSIIRMNPRSRQAAIDNGTRALEWNLATAVNLNKSYNTGSKAFLFGNPGSLKERNDLIEVLCKGTRWSQRTEFRDQVRDFHISYQTSWGGR